MGGDSGIPFGNYTLLRRIARGGMAEVFVARQKGIDGFDRLVAIKRILPHLLDDKSFVGMFQDEARLAARLSHPNVIHIYDFGKVEEHFFIAMEFMHGVHAGDLIRLAEEKPMPAALVARIGADACAGLHYAHNRRDESGGPLKLVHRDVSPPNLLVSYDGVVKIVDFGIAKAVSSIEQTRPGVVKGKYAYMSPEQTMGQALDGRSDVFSLAIVMWELLSGKPAVTRSDQILAMKTIRDGKVAPIGDVREDVPEALASCLQRALHKDPKKRSDARAFGNELESFIKSSSVIATRMELGTWLTDRIPPEDIVGPEKTGFGTRQATMATSLKPGTADSATAMAAQLAELDIPRSSDESRGSVVSALPGVHFADQEPTRVLAASGNLLADSGSAIPPLDTGSSVMVDSDLMARSDYTAATRLVANDVEVITSSQLAALDYDDDDEETAMVPPPTESATETTPALAGPTAVEDDGLGSPTEVDEAAPPPALEFYDNDKTYEDHQRPPSVDALASFHPQTPSAPAAPAIPMSGLHTGGIEPAPRSKLGLWIGLGVILGLALVAILGSSEIEQPAADLDVSDAGSASYADGAADTPTAPVPAPMPNRIPPIMVTPLLDAGAVASADAASAAAQSPDAAAPRARDKSNRRKRKRPRAQPGRLAIKTSPYSVVYHRGKKLGTTPMANLAMPAGRYRLVFKNPNFQPVSKTAVVEAGKTTKLDFALEP